MIEGRDLPVGPKPGWELEQPDSDDQECSLPLKSVADSLLVLHSLKQSRANWLSSTFPKFSSKSRGGKVSDTIPPPHTMRSLGKFDFQVGPHIFPDTSIYEAHYLPSTPAPQPPRPVPNQPSASAWQTAPAYRAPTYTPYFPYGLSATPSTATYPSLQRASTPLVSAVASETPITPALINRVNDAASTDPILANFLQLAASGRASSDQLKTLALLIQSLASAQSSILGSVSGSDAHSAFNPLNLLGAQMSLSTPSPSASSTPPSSVPSSHPNSGQPTPTQTPAPAASQPPKEFDLVLEFPERPYDRWLVPRVPVVCERTPSAGNIEAILLLFALPFPKQKQEESESATSTGTDLPQEVVQFRITKVHQTFWTSLLNWAGGSTKVETNRQILEKIAVPERVYLQHQLPEGDLLTKLQAAASPYSMKSIKPPHGDRSSTRRRAAPRRTASTTESSQGSGAPAPKRKRSSQSKPGSESKKIACVSCGQTDVPLMMGGRFCRPCVDAGKTGNEGTASPQDVTGAQSTTPPPPPQSEAPTTAAISKRIAGLAAPPLISRSPLATNPPLVPESADSTSVTPPGPDPPVAQP